MATFPATHMQAWYFHANAIGWSVVAVPVVVRVKGQIRWDDLERAVNDLIARHPSLRTTLHARGDRVVQEIHDPVPFHLGDQWLPSGLHDSARVVAEEIAAPFFVPGGPLVRVRVVPMEDGDRALVFNAHHSICDGLSARLICRDLFELYLARRERRDPELPALEVHMGDYAAWENLVVRGGADAYWRERLATGNPRADYGRGATADAAPALLAVRSLEDLHADAVCRLEQVAAATGTTLARVLGAAVTAAAATHAGREITVRVTTANRHRQELRDVVGNVAEWLPVRVHLGGDPSFVEFVTRFGGAVRDAYDHQLPSAALLPVMRANPERATGPLFDLEVNFLDAPDEPDLVSDGLGELVVEGGHWSPLWRPVVDGWHDELPVVDVLHERQADGSVTGQLVVNEMAVPHAAAKQLAQRVDRAIRRACAHADVGLSELGR